MSEKFWHLNWPDSTLGRADWDDDVDIESIVCPLKEGHRGGEKRITDLHIVLLSKRITDFIWVHECIIQDRVLKMFQEEGFTGFEVKPVQARMKRKYKKAFTADANSTEYEEIEIPTLWELIVTGWGGIAPSESGVRLTEYCPGCGVLRYEGISNPFRFIDEAQWDGSDFFFVWPLRRWILITDRVAKFIKAHKLTGVQIEPIESIKTSGQISASRSSLVEISQRIGKPLDIPE